MEKSPIFRAGWSLEAIYKHMSVSGSKAWKNEADPNLSLENIEDFNVNSLSFLLSLNVSIINPWFLT